MLGGDACPLGLTLQWVRAPERAAVDALPGALRRVRSRRTRRAFPQALETLLPFQAPWSRMLTGQAGPWTVIANNAVGGGDGTAPGPAVARALGVRGVVATHAPPYGPGHAQTQLEVTGPGGSGPLQTIRTLSATATDGRWAWYTDGDPLPFEDVERYAARRIRDRFDRAMLLGHLEALGVPTDDDAYGPATLHQVRSPWARRAREQTLAEARAALIG